MEVCIQVLVANVGPEGFGLLRSARVGSPWPGCFGRTGGESREAFWWGRWGGQNQWDPILVGT